MTKKEPQQLILTKQKRPLFIFTTIFIFLILFTLLISGCTSLLLPQKDTGTVAVIPIIGPIIGSDSSSFHSVGVTSSQVISQLEKASNDPSIEAVVLEINSPGGTPVASAEIVSAVKDMDKPVVAWIRETGASGAYWIASSADYIIAHDLSITGSIGVTSSYLEFNGFLDEYNITYNRQVVGQYKDMGSPLKHMTTLERYKNQKLLGTIYNYFVADVAANRNLSIADVKKLATGEVYLGLDAKDLGLVDQLGSKKELTAYLETIIKSPVDYVYYKKQSSFIDSLFSMKSSIAQQVGVGIGSVLIENSAKQKILL